MSFIAGSKMWPSILAAAMLMAISVFSNGAEVAQMSSRGQQMPKDFLIGKFLPSRHPDFAKVELPLGNKKGMFLQRKAYEAFVSMAKDAEKSGIRLTVISATRTFKQQKNIWEAKWKKQPADLDASDRAMGVLRFTSMPGTSRHHWGTDIDLNSLENDYFQKGEGLRVYRWLSTRAKEFGFCQPYTPKGHRRPNGYEEEKWHWSYVPLAGSFLRQYAEKVSLQDLKGFEGSDTASALNLIERYVLGINSECR